MHNPFLKRPSRGLSQVEVVISTIIISVLMVSSLSTIAASRRSQLAESNEVGGLAIAEALLAEITQLPVRDPACDCGFGPESGETGTSRIGFDDVDDYHNLVDFPPKSRSGISLSGYSDLSRNVSIDMVSVNNWNTTATNYEGVYRITIRVLRDNIECARLVGYRSAGSQGAATVTNSSLN